MKVFVAALLLAVGVFAGEECIDDDPHCKKFDAEELVMYCNDPSTGVGKGCCESCKGYMRPESLSKRGEEAECVDNYEVCSEYRPDDLEKYCNDPETGVPEECCKTCEVYIGKGKTLSKREITFPEICEDEKSENGEVCKLYSPRDLDSYCHDESDGVLDLCCATCKAHLQAATLLKRSEKAECVDNMEVCKTYGQTSLALYCNDPSTGVAEECCASCQGYIKPTLLKLDPCSGPCTREYTPICGTDGRTYNNRCLFKQGQCRNPALEIAYYGVCKDKRGVEETCVDKPRFAAVCKIYDEEELGLYCNDPETGVLDNCCASCQGHLHDVEEEEEKPELLKRGIEWPEVCQDSDDEYGAHCKLYSPKDLGKYCPDPSTGMMEVCCGTCKAALQDF